METSSIIVVDILSEIVAAVDAQLFPVLNRHINFQPGRPSQILAELQKMTNSAEDIQKAKWPLVAGYMDFNESRGNSGYYASASIPRLLIAFPTDQNDPVVTRYNKNFRTILYPIYNELLRRIVRHRNVVGNDPDTIVHNKFDRPGSKQEEGNLNEWLDAIDMSNLQLTLKKVNPCRSISKP